jgi:drug/metabolite transporter (DMT)-like permease
VLNALVWGLSWWPLRALQQQGLHPLWATVIIYALALLCLQALRPVAWRAFWRHPQLFLLALAAGLTNIGFNWAVTTGDVVRVVLLFYLMPAWSILLAWLLLGDKPGTHALLRLVLALAGVVVVLKTPGSPWPLPASLADWLALLGGLCFALTNVLLLKLNDTPGEARMFAMFIGGAAMALAASLLGLHLGLAHLPPALAPGWLTLALLTGLAFLVGNLGLQYGAARLPASTTSLIMVTEVVFAAVSSVLYGAARLTGPTMLGGAMVMLAALWAARSDR